jgi:hypothetical protein
MLSALGRIVSVTFAFVAAAAFAGFIAVRLGLERMTHELHSDDDAAVTVVGWVWQGLNLSFATTLLLALAVVIVGEVARIRSGLYYIAGGGLAVAAAPLLIEVQRQGGTGNLPGFIWQVFATAGFAGGALYWMIAGRNA